IADCKSGVSGAGRELKLGSMFVEAADTLKAYAVPGHRHGVEITQGLTAIAKTHVSLTFVPHLAPMIRGIHATLYARLKNPLLDVQSLYANRFADEPMVDVLPPGSHPETRSVRGANTCQIAVHKVSDGKSVVILAVIDNLVKGASGQAVQCFNLMFGIDEATALDAPAAPHCARRHARRAGGADALRFCAQRRDAGFAGDVFADRACQCRSRSHRAPAA